MSAAGYHLWRMHPDGSVSQCAKFALDALESGMIKHFQFQYLNGSYPQLTFNNSVILPSLTQVTNAAKVFNLSAAVGRQIGEQVANALQQWHTLFAECGVSEQDCQQLAGVFNVAKD